MAYFGEAVPRAVPFGKMFKVVAVEPIKGKIKPSMSLNELWKERVTELSINPETRVTAPADPKFVVGTSAAEVVNVIAATLELTSVPASWTTAPVKTNFAMIIYLLPYRLSRLNYLLKLHAQRRRAMIHQEHPSHQ
jgi:hypothetical protein